MMFTLYGVRPPKVATWNQAYKSPLAAPAPIIKTLALKCERMHTYKPTIAASAAYFVPNHGSVDKTKTINSDDGIV